MYRTWRGLIDGGDCLRGVCGNTGVIDYPGLTYEAYLDAMPSTQGAPVSWHGTLFADGLDDSGLMYRRNRYYDPATGQFTQEDPLGLAGGMNAYGFGNGDPITYSDPFGLCPIPPWDCGLLDLEIEHPKATAAVAVAGIAVLGMATDGLADLALGGDLLEAADALEAVNAADATEEESGIVYERTNPSTGEKYVGRSRSQETYLNRQSAHDGKLSVKHNYEVIDRGKPGKDLRAAEESAIRSRGGPGKLANRRYEMNDAAYREAGGNVDKPPPEQL